MMKNSVPKMVRSAQPFELWTASLPAPQSPVLKCGRRPVVVVSEDFCGEASTVTVIPLTRNRTDAQRPGHVLLCSRFLDAPSRALCEQVTTIDHSRLVRRIGFVEDAFDRFAIRRALSTHLNLTSLQNIVIQEPSLFVPADAV